MRWEKRGLIYCPTGKYGYDTSHCHKPTPLILDKDTIRLYFGVRDEKNKTRTTFIDLDANIIKKVEYVHDKPILDLGKIGTFDDSGAQVCSVVRNGTQIFMYYIGWNTSTTVPSRNSLGLAISKDNGFTFQRAYDGPILERYKNEAYHIGASDVLKENDFFKMWYDCGIGYRKVNGYLEYQVHIKYATSKNGIDWKRHDITCVTPSSDDEVVVRPSVHKSDNIYKMWYSRRNIKDFRANKNNSYRPGYAYSKDGLIWERADEEVEMPLSKKKSGWDSEMIAYPYVVELEDKLIMFYNGNGFGRTGVGYAISKKL